MKRSILKIIFVAAFLLPVCSVAQLNNHSFPELDSLQKIEKRPIVVFIHTDWCRYCQAMKNTGFKNRQVVALLNEKFWFFGLDAEDKKDILFKGQLFRYKPTGAHTGIHELAEQLGTIEGQIAYPTLCILNADFEIIFQHNQFLPPADLLKLLNGILKKS
jgi:thioredoxin-related protein